MRTLALAVALLIPLASMAACPTPTQWASSFYAEHYSFYADEPTVRIKRKVSKSFADLLAREAAYAAGEVGHLGYDPWLGAQDGEVTHPKFALETSTDETAIVAMSYRFRLGDEEPTQSRVVHLILQKDEGCWRLDDFITPLGESLARLYSQP
jgi:hypothetical protein